MYPPNDNNNSIFTTWLCVSSHDTFLYYVCCIDVIKKINSCAIRTTVNTVMSICLKVSQMLFKCKSHNIRTTIEIDFTR